MFRTNFDKKDLPKYQRTIIDFKAKTGSDRFYIKDEAFDGNGALMPTSRALHDKETSDTSLFWQIFDSTEVITSKEMLENMQYYMEYCQKNKYVTPMEWIANIKHF